MNISNSAQNPLESIPAPEVIPSQVSAAAADSPNTFLTIADVEREVTLKKSTIFAMVKEGTFPAPIRIGKRASRWTRFSVSSWKEALVSESRKEVK